MQKFDTRVQHLKYKVLREMARNAFNDTLLENFSEIPKLLCLTKNQLCVAVFTKNVLLSQNV